MPINPMKRKTRISFLLGVLITLVITIVVICIIYFTIIKPKEEETKEQIVTYVYKLKNPVESGTEITANMVESIEVPKEAIPQNVFFSKYEDADKNLLDMAWIAGYKAKVSLSSGTILSRDVLYTEELITNDVRLAEFNMITLPTTISIGDYIDIRLSLSTGQDFIVISKKRVESLQGETIGLYLSEEEILIMNSAIVEAYIAKASKFYAIQYIEPGIQAAAIYTYRPANSVIEQINSDPNIVNTAKNKLIDLYTQNSSLDIRNRYIEPALAEYNDNRKVNVEEGLKQQIENAKKARQEYLSGMAGY